MKTLFLKLKNELWLVLIFTTLFCFSKNNPPLNSKPNWVKEVTFSDSKNKEQVGGYRYLLVDTQDNLITQTAFRHYVIKIINSDGIQNMSDLEFSFDPSYQKFNLHEVSIIRNGKKIDKSKDSETQTIQKESSSERSIYDGSLSTIINLNDIRENDILDYSYSIQGFNPINQGNFSTTYYQQFTFPIEKISTKLITSSNKKIIVKNFENATSPTIRKGNNQTVYSWELEASDYLLYDNNVPSWYDPQKRVSVSTYKDWTEVVKWALPLYNYNKRQVKNLQLIQEKGLTKDKTIAEIIRFTQDDIRYLGFESGISAYKPHAPKKVFKQRYGDCKDKSLLLVSLLRKEGVEAYPLLVNTNLKEEIINMPPSNSIFNHCVVFYKYHDKEYFIDPTISNQGGAIDTINFPNYKYGLLVKEGEKSLIKIPDAEKSTLTINELIKMDSIGGNASLVVTSKYTGAKADYIRSYFNSSSIKAIQKEYLNYYSNLYPDIHQFEKIEIKDEFRNSTNKLTIIEKYTIQNFWKPIDSVSSNIYAELYPLVLESLLEYSNSADRKMPYYIGGPSDFTQTTKIILPEEWSVENDSAIIKGNGYEYKNIISGVYNTVTVSHKFNITKEYIPANEVSTFLKDNESIKTNLTFNLSYNGEISGFKLSWASILLALLSATAMSLFLYKNYKTFNPSPITTPDNLKIGGWLILPLFGLCFSPIRLIKEFFTEDFFNHNTWSGLIELNSENTYSILSFIGTEIIYNSALLIFSIYILILYFNKRTSLPIMVSILYGTSVIIPLIDSYYAQILFPNENFEYFTKDFFQSILGAAIWIPYFNFSERSKNTFVNTYTLTKK